jgi:hypothetical protein
MINEEVKEEVKIDYNEIAKSLKSGGLKLQKK